ncbi:MAG TPA: hypothetical protein VGM11_15805 [Acidobacteriaceae bacterium]
MLLASATPRVNAQTYNPKAIHFESSDASQHLDSAELLRITGLHEGVPLTKADIEDALHKLGDSGAFSNLSYTVNNAALTIRLTPAGGGQALPVRFANFVWWSHDELIQILEARVPLFHGTLPLQGTQTGDVEDALAALLRDKGVPNGRITAMPSTSSPNGPMDAIALSITSPEILVGQTQFNGAIPEVATKLNTFNRELAGRDFDRQDVTNTLHQTLQEIFEDSGYLDVTNDMPVFSTPRKDLNNYIVDVQVTLHPGALYRVGAITLHAQPPLTEADLRAALPFKSGDPASASDFRVAFGTLARVYADHAFLDARTSASVDKHSSNHTIDYSFTFEPGAQFRFAGMDTSALPIDLQQEFASLWHATPGTLADKAFEDTLRASVLKLHTRSAIILVQRRDTVTHTLSIKLRFRSSSVTGADSAPGSNESTTSTEPE